MSELPTTKNELFSEIEYEIEYVRDIGTDKKYGIALSGRVPHEGENISVLGSVVLDPDTGSPSLEHKRQSDFHSVPPETSIHAYPNGLLYESVEILSGQDAVEAIEELCQRNGISDPFKKEDDVNINSDAR